MEFKPEESYYRIEKRSWEYRGCMIEVQRLGYTKPVEPGIFSSHPQDHHFCEYVVLRKYQFRNTSQLRAFTENKGRDKFGADDVFRGGETYHEDDPTYIKIGCDHNHSWNHEQGFYGSWEYCLHNCIEAIDKLHAAISLNVWDQANGDIVTEEELERRHAERRAKAETAKASPPKEAEDA